MGYFGNTWTRIWESILDNRNKLTATGGIIVGVILTLTFKDLYPDLEQSFRRRLGRFRGIEAHHALPGQPDYVRLEDHTQRTSRAITDAHDIRRTTTAEERPIAVGIEGLIGNTPLIKLRSVSEATGCEILAKAEFLNGAGNSPKDRVALSMINHAEAEGLIVPDRGDTIYEGTVGSTGISLAKRTSACPMTSPPRSPTCF
jgi:cysteine synthase A